MLCLDPTFQTNKSIHLPLTMLARRACRPLIHRVRWISDLGLRAHLPPDTQPKFDVENEEPHISDQEWEIRTG